MKSSAVPLAASVNSPAYVPGASVMTSPGFAAFSAAVSEAASVTATACGCAGSFAGTGRVVPWSVTVVPPPSGSVAVSSMSYVVPGARSKMLPANSATAPPAVTSSGCTRKSGIASWKAPPPVR